MYYSTVDLSFIWWIWSDQISHSYAVATLFVFLTLMQSQSNVSDEAISLRVASKIFWSAFAPTAWNTQPKVNHNKVLESTKSFFPFFSSSSLKRSGLHRGWFIDEDRKQLINYNKLFDFSTMQISDFLSETTNWKSYPYGDSRTNLYLFHKTYMLYSGAPDDRQPLH